MTSVSTLSFLKSRLYSKSRLFNVKFHFGHKNSFLKTRLYVKSRFIKSRLYCIFSNGSLLFTNLFLLCFVPHKKSGAKRMDFRTVKGKAKAKAKRISKPDLSSSPRKATKKIQMTRMKMKTFVSLCK